MNQCNQRNQRKWRTAADSEQRGNGGKYHRQVGHLNRMTTNQWVTCADN